MKPGKLYKTTSVMFVWSQRCDSFSLSSDTIKTIKLGTIFMYIGEVNSYRFADGVSYKILVGDKVYSLINKGDHLNRVEEIGNAREKEEV